MGKGFVGQASAPAVGSIEKQCIESWTGECAVPLIHCVSLGKLLRPKMASDFGCPAGPCIPLASTGMEDVWP